MDIQGDAARRDPKLPRDVVVTSGGRFGGEEGFEQIKELGMAASRVFDLESGQRLFEQRQSPAAVVKFLGGFIGRHCLQIESLGILRVIQREKLELRAALLG